MLFVPSLAHADDNVELEPPFGLESALAAAARTDSSAPVVRLGLVCMTKQPSNLHTWLRYHHEQLGVRLIFLRVEDTPELSELLSSAPWDELVVATYASRTQADYITQVERQSEHVNHAISQARERGLTHLLHLDDDELLYCPSGVRSLHRALCRAPQRAVDLHLENLEALLPTDECTNPFVQASAFRHKPATFCAYSNGKSIGRLDCPELVARGAHHFSDGSSAAGRNASTFRLPAHVAVILHYESGSYAQWRRKFERLQHHKEGSRAFEEMSGFYQQSVRSLAAIREARSQPEQVQAEAAALALYRRAKLQPNDLPDAPANGGVRMLRPLGITLIRPLSGPRYEEEPRGHRRPHASSAAPSAGPPSCGAEREIARLELEAMLEVCRVPSTCAAWLLDHGITAGFLLKSSRADIELAAKSAGLPLGQRLRLGNAARAADAAFPLGRGEQEAERRVPPECLRTHDARSLGPQSGLQPSGAGASDDEVRRDWNTTLNAKFDRNCKVVEHLQMSEGERGCAASHISLWRRCVESNSPLLVLEDDAILAEGCCRSLQLLATCITRTLDPEERKVVLYLGGQVRHPHGQVTPTLI
ncbi:hypothetical protein AB1Y20_005308 [Prymnesium parvum]|uniref:Glycosyl transferase family 25 domain-containing protein n=1 Tax=Prymnesium parvum TaxID=97485 RepID=A0AB34J3S9_PRYPA